MREVRKIYVAEGHADDMCEALGVSSSWLSNAAKNGGELKRLHVYSYWTDRKKELTEEEMAAMAVDAISERARMRLKALIRRSGV